MACILPVWHASYQCRMHLTSVACSLPVWHASYQCRIQLTSVACSLPVSHASYQCGMHLTSVACTLPVSHASYQCGLHLTSVACIFISKCRTNQFLKEDGGIWTMFLENPRQEHQSCIGNHLEKGKDEAKKPPEKSTSPET